MPGLPPARCSGTDRGGQRRIGHEATIALEGRGSSDLMLGTLACLAEQGYTACVGDGGSSSTFVDTIRGMGHEVRQPGRGLVGMRPPSPGGRAWTHVFYLESDKLGVRGDATAPNARSVPSSPARPCTIGRDRAAVRGFRSLSAEIELAQSTLIGDVLGICGDWVAGPVTLALEPRREPDLEPVTKRHRSSRLGRAVVPAGSRAGGRASG